MSGIDVLVRLVLLISLCQSSSSPLIDDIVVVEVEHLPCAANTATEIVLAKDEGHACKQSESIRVHVKRRREEVICLA